MDALYFDGVEWMRCILMVCFDGVEWMLCVLMVLSGCTVLMVLSGCAVF